MSVGKNFRIGVIPVFIIIQLGRSLAITVKQIRKLEWKVFTC